MSKSDTLLSSASVKKLYNKPIDLVFAIILLFITVTMIIGVVRLFYRVGDLLQAGGITGNYLYIFTDVLTLFILIVLSRSLFEFFTTHRIRLTTIIDAGIVFVLRHIMIELFNHKLDTDSTYAMSALILALGAVRIGVSIVYQQEKNVPSLPDTQKSEAPH